MEVSEMDNGEILQRGIEDFREIQEYMSLSKKENATAIYWQNSGNLYFTRGIEQEKLFLHRVYTVWRNIFTKG